eukprot:CAMPEP_0167772854 /NCGR_PEP_ID=MMETSP0111_2-20121227/1085_1 /TAXON_ID=91324 /ORGANISM="Lotharella globosa, Strain CCCM811" /LENGTH=439 /DNA_ID=CAMNT_0007662405 /DNA_START=378 /DNA_END=1697 /DNA_ORIENTATION=+
MCDEGNRRLGVMLRLPNELPKEFMQLVTKWKGEPIKAVVLPTTAFAADPKGYPVLKPDHAKAFLTLTTADSRVIISGPSIYKDHHRPFLGALQALWQSLPEPTEQLQLEMPYRDFLQAPLQPLMDNLQSQTYETFERDPVKYAQYEKAIYKALVTRHKDDESVCLVVVGAGRGPLVRCALRAAKEAKTTLRLYAVEKNKNAINTLQNAVLNEWGSSVTVIEADMREWKAPEKADIMVSELLGSFGDNELSPECLDGAQWVLKETGISIPASSTSFIQPVSCQKVWSELKATGHLKSFETPYVVLLHRAFNISAVERCFHFVHPNPQNPIDNTRHVHIKFEPAKEASVLHGFAGYFESKLFEDVIISINPETFSTGMFSWFPILFPLRTPIQIRKGDVIEFDLWRCEDRSKVWYEWCLGAPVVSAVHNPSGRSYQIGLKF